VKPLLWRRSQAKKNHQNCWRSRARAKKRRRFSGEGTEVKAQRRKELRKGLFAVEILWRGSAS
jgi:hypothetical protein